MHSHPPRMIVALTSHRLKSIDQQGRVTSVDRHPGEVVWSNGEEHAAEMMMEHPRLRWKSGPPVDEEHGQAITGPLSKTT